MNNYCPAACLRANADELRGFQRKQMWEVLHRGQWLYIKLGLRCKELLGRVKSSSHKQRTWVQVSSTHVKAGHNTESTQPKGQVLGRQSRGAHRPANGPSVGFSFSERSCLKKSKVEKGRESRLILASGCHVYVICTHQNCSHKENKEWNLGYSSAGKGIYHQTWPDSMDSIPGTQMAEGEKQLPQAVRWLPRRHHAVHSPIHTCIHQ